MRNSIRSSARRVLVGAALLGAPAACVAPSAESFASRPVRIGVLATPESVEPLSTLRYRGGFETKTLVYETLTRRDAEGRIAPGLASSWRFESGGAVVVLELRAGARYHDGTAVTAESVAQHLRRWVGLPEHAWLRGSGHVRAIEVLSERELRITLDEPYALLPDLCAINPCGIRGPGTLDREGEFVRPIGSGPFRFEAAREEGRVLRYRAFDPDSDAEGRAVDLVLLAPDADVVGLLQDGALDVLFDGWITTVPRERVAELRSDRDFDVTETAGSSVVHLGFSPRASRPQQRGLRRALRACLDRAELVRDVELGFADPCASWAAPTVGAWPRSAASDTPAEEPVFGSDTPVVLLVQLGRAREERVAEVLAAQWRRAGMRVEVRAVAPDAYRCALASGAFDVRIEETWGVPYDPYLSLLARFLPPPTAPNAVDRPSSEVHEQLVSLVREASRQPDQEGRSRLYAGIQRFLDEEVLVIGLFVPRRVAVVRKGWGTLGLDHDLYRIDLSGIAPSRAAAGSVSVGGRGR